MKKRNKLNNKGFSLVELIIVIAIMAILVGAVTPQVIKYVEKSREAKDLQVLQTVFTAAQTTILTDEEAIDKDMTISLKTADATDTEENKIRDEILNLAGSNILTKLISKKAKGNDIYIEYDTDTGALEVGVESTAGKVDIGKVTN